MKTQSLDSQDALRRLDESKKRIVLFLVGTLFSLLSVGAAYMNDFTVARCLIFGSIGFYGIAVLLWLRTTPSFEK
jgi:hypothetical protein